mgnify:CR=1 FL=1
MLKISAFYLDKQKSCTMYILFLKEYEVYQVSRIVLLSADRWPPDVLTFLVNFKALGTVCKTIFGLFRSVGPAQNILGPVEKMTFKIFSATSASNGMVALLSEK